LSTRKTSLSQITVTVLPLELTVLVTFSQKARNVTVEGPRGKLIRKFKHVTFEIIESYDKKAKKNNKSIRTWLTNRKLKARTRTIASHIKNMINGVVNVIIHTQTEPNIQRVSPSIWRSATSISPSWQLSMKTEQFSR